MWVRRNTSRIRSAPRPRTAVCASPPMIIGATTAVTLLINRWSKNEPSTSPPPSTSRLTTPCSRPSRSSNAANDTRPFSSAGSLATSTLRDARASLHSADAADVVAISVREDDVSSRTRLSSGVRPRLSRITRSGCGTGPLQPSGRAVSCGLSTMIVSTPTSMASNSGRFWCAQRRVWGPEIHRESPLVDAIRPSSDAANLAVTKGRPVLRWCT